MENMTIAPDLSQAPRELEKPKRMLEISTMPDGRQLVAINFSSLSVINDCMRKAQYSLIDGYRSNIEADALTFGKGIHKALEHWYCLNPSVRQLTDHENELADTLIASPLTAATQPEETALDSINEFVKTCQPLQWLGDSDKRSLNNGIKILKSYFKHYANDNLETLRDASGKPYVEQNVEFEMHSDSEKVIRFHGAIDIILKDTISGQVFISDHKTTASLGTAFYNRIKPNHQYTGYIMAARECLGIETDSFLVNGIQVAKTKSEFARQATTRNEEDFAELKASMVEAVERVLQAKKTGVFTMNTPGSCNNYGSCQYLEVCGAPAKLRDTILRAKYAEALNPMVAAAVVGAR